MNELFGEVRAEETLRAAVERSGLRRTEALRRRQGHRHVRASGGRRRVVRGGRPQSPTRRSMVRTPIFEPGTGAYTMFAQVAAEVLGVGMLAT